MGFVVQAVDDSGGDTKVRVPLPYDKPLQGVRRNYILFELHAMERLEGGSEEPANSPHLMIKSEHPPRRRHVKAEPAGPEYGATTYSVFTRVNGRNVHEEATYEVPKYSLEARPSQESRGDERGCLRANTSVTLRGYLRPWRRRGA